MEAIVFRLLLSIALGRVICVCHLWLKLDITAERKQRGEACLLLPFTSGETHAHGMVPPTLSVVLPTQLILFKCSHGFTPKCAAAIP